MPDLDSQIAHQQELRRKALDEAKRYEGQPLYATLCAYKMQQARRCGEKIRELCEQRRKLAP
jgi:hypothetical protein